MMMHRVSRIAGAGAGRVHCDLVRRASTATVAAHASFGDPATVLKLEEKPLAAVGPNDVKVRMLAAPVNPADLNMVQGVYGIRPELPAVGGNEGVGIVEEVGKSVKSVANGDWVIPAKAGMGTWRSYAVWDAKSVSKVPKSIPVEYAATISVNPCTAYRLLKDFVNLKEGDVLIQNGANSAVGECVYQMAAARGIRTINVIRGRDNYEEVAGRMKAHGATIVVTDDYIRTPDFKRLIADLPAPKLALNCVGGENATNVARALAPGGTMVTYGGMSKRPVQVPTSLLIFKDIQLRGFWMSRWVDEHSAADRDAMIADIAAHMAESEGEPADSGSLQPDYKNVKQGLKMWVERQPFSDLAGGIERATRPQRDRKVVFTMDDK